MAEEQPVTGNVLEADDNPGDVDSGIEDADNSDGATSIASDILQYRRENGRTYHSYKDGKYFYPNDDTENDRLDLQHHLFLLTLNDKLFLAPVKSPQEVLDVGTGTGIWAMDFGDEFPAARVTGIDLSPTQPSFVPPNVSFLVDDAEEPWAYSDKFDLVHFRMMTGSFSDPAKVFKEAYESLKPGAYIELQDTSYPMECDDESMKPESALLTWSQIILECTEKMGKSLGQAKQYKKWLREAGFVDICETVFKWPINAWPKNKKDKVLGLWMQENIFAGLQAYSLGPLTRGKGWSRDRVETFLVDVRKDVKDRNLHGYFPIYVIYAKKAG